MDKAYIDLLALYNIHKVGAFFVIRAKVSMAYDVVERNFNVDQSIGLRTYRTIQLTGYKSSKLYPDILRMVEYCDDKKEILLVFITNNFEVSALEVASLYRNRWQIEVFFKWMKQNLTIKKIWGHSENAVNIHIWVAICTYLIVAEVKHALKSDLPIYEIMQILSISAFDKTPLAELLTQTQVNQNIKEQLNLFSNNF
ncbi:IS4 family transposase [Prolixibacteraceae bacterium Z1-6]|uniref:IS4 family transposase n=1 Tax=Draconibacterium aestuarii TaxID=2998507 RepID=A0A9X3J4R4_9BACT|nr:IS4 family transposase [Prolixibacteraceae bacterium Z1-6]